MATSPPPSERPSSNLEPEDQDDGYVGTVLMIFGFGFDYRHYEGTRAALERAGYRVLIASDTSGPIEGVEFAHGYETMSRTRRSKIEAWADLLVKDVRVEDYQAIIFISDNALMSGKSPEVRRIVQQAAEGGVVLAAQEFALYILAGAGVLKGVEVTANPLICQQMEVDYGAICKQMPIQSHSRIITTGPTFSSVHFVQAIVEAIQEGG
jgi:putative intracellular protease/amidase